MTISLIDFTKVKNRNEKRVIRSIEELIAQESDVSRLSILSEKDWQDIYALALNHLPARYAQPGTIVIGDPVRDEDAQVAVRDAFDIVFNRPKD